MAWKLKEPIAIICIMATFFMIIAALFSIWESDESDSMPQGTAKVSDQVMKWKPLVKKYAKKNGISEYVPVILAMIQQESGGRGGDVMQSSESLGMAPNAIGKPENSIKVGVKELADVLKQADGDLQLALQGYNFGNGFISYADQRGGYSQKVAQSFSEMMARKLGWDHYGDTDYVKHIFRFIQPQTTAGKANKKGFVPPIHSTEITSPFGERANPVGTGGEFHAGIDISCHQDTIPVFAAKEGIVTRAGWQNPTDHSEGYGQRVYIKSGKLTIVYGHLSKMFVETGEKVRAGQPIARCGTTGSSTGRHLHFEVKVNGQVENPLNYIALKK